MNRIENIKKYAEEYIINSINLQMEIDRKYLCRHANEVKNGLALKMNQILRQNKGIDKITICYLYSSIAMKKHELCLIPFADIPFVEWPESEILKTSIIEEKYFERILREKFVQLLPYEVEEIRREYMCLYSEKIGELLSEILNDSESGVRIFYGAYMDEIKEIGRIVL